MSQEWYHYQPRQDCHTIEKNSSDALRGRTFCLLLQSLNFIHIDLVGVPILSWGCNFAHYFQEEMNALFFVLRVPEDLGSNYCAMQLCQLAGRRLH